MHRGLAWSATTGRTRWTERLATILVILITLLTADAFVLSAPAKAATPNCGPNPSGLQACDYYTTDAYGVQHLAGSNTATPSRITTGTVIHQTATNHLLGYWNSFGSEGMGSVSMQAFGPITDYSPKASSTMAVTVNRRSVTWSAIETTTNGGNCPVDPLAPCDGTPTGEFVPGETFSLTAPLEDFSGSDGTVGIGASWGSTFGSGASYAAPVSLYLADTPVAEFSEHPNGRNPGEFQFVSSSTDPGGSALVQTWSLGDGATATGPAVTHTYRKPGTYHVKLTVKNAAGKSASVTHNVVVKPPELGVTIAFIDADGHVLPTIAPTLGSSFRLRVTASASSAGVGALSHVSFATAPVTVTPAGILTLSKPTPTPSANLTLEPGHAQAYVYTARVKAAGVFRFASSVTAKDSVGHSVGPATAQLSASVAGLKVTIKLTPSSINQDEDAKGPKPINVTALITITNITDKPATDVNLRSLQTAPAKAGQVIKIEQTSGPHPDPIAGFALPPLAPGASEPVNATFRALDDGEIDFTTLVTAAGDTTTLRGLGRARLSIKPKYLLKFASQVVHPNGSLLPAGKLIEIRGTVKNLSNTATLHVGPLYPQPAGNAGLMGLGYDGDLVSPYDPTAPPALLLDPGQTRRFTLQVTTAYSDPRTYPDPTGSKVAKTGGTRASFEFTPWAEATLDDGSTKIVETKDVLSDHANLTHDVSIDDSIPIPQTSYVLLAGAISAGAIEGVYNAAVGLLWGVVQLAKLPYTTLVAATQFQAQVWKSFTEEERDRLSTNVATTAVAVLRRNLSLGLKNTEQLVAQVKATTLKSMTELEDQWQVGDYAETARLYSKFGTEQIASVAVPIALAKLAKSPAAISALSRAQEALQTRMAPLLADVAGLRRIEQVGPLLTTILSGTELDAAAIETLYGIAPEELAELQQLATKYKFLLTVRSRHASSIKWIAEKFAMLKPESLKIKTVSSLDTKLGYSRDDIGSLVFKKPEALALWEKSGLGDEELAAYIRDYLKAKGFTPGTGEYYEAIARVSDRSKEWNKWNATYQEWSKQGWLPTTFNYEGNAIGSNVRSSFSKMNGFRLRPVGADEYIVEMYNYKVKAFVPVTGDIDPISFTHLDGSPLSAEEHAALLDDMQSSPLLQTQHGESATYVKGGVKFVSEQFKPNEAALQIAPGNAAPRVVRLDVAKSRWVNPFDYNLQWDGGFVGIGQAPDAAGYPAYLAPGSRGLVTSVAAQTHGVLPLPATSTTGPTVGRCAVVYSSSGPAAPLVMGADGVISTFALPGRTTTDDPTDNSRCFTPGPVIQLIIKPTTQLSGTIQAGTLEVPIVQSPGLAPSNTSHATGTDVGFSVGDEIVIGAGTPDAETRTITGFGSLILNRPLAHAHHAGEIVVVVKVHAQTPALAVTGVDLESLLRLAVVMLLLGSLMLAATSRRDVSSVARAG